VIDAALPFEPVSREYSEPNMNQDARSAITPSGDLTFT
jgi:hypothetical protein